MRDMRPATPDEFRAYLAANPELQQRRVGAMQCYVDAGEWPDNLVASFMPAGEGRRRDGGWRIATENDDATPV